MVVLKDFVKVAQRGEHLDAKLSETWDDKMDTQSADVPVGYSDDVLAVEWVAVKDVRQVLEYVVLLVLMMDILSDFSSVAELAIQQAYNEAVDSVELKVYVQSAEVLAVQQDVDQENKQVVPKVVRKAVLQVVCLDFEMVVDQVYYLAVLEGVAAMDTLQVVNLVQILAFLKGDIVVAAKVAWMVLFWVIQWAGSMVAYVAALMEAILVDCLGDVLAAHQVEKWEVE